jgi:hypothetical protein
VYFDNSHIKTLLNCIAHFIDWSVWNENAKMTSKDILESMMLKHSRFIVKEYFKFDAHWLKINKNLKVSCPVSFKCYCVNSCQYKFDSICIEQWNSGVCPKWWKQEKIKTFYLIITPKNIFHKVSLLWTMCCCKITTSLKT